MEFGLSFWLDVTHSILGDAKEEDADSWDHMHLWDFLILKFYLLNFNIFIIHYNYL